jgi:hypothetical protein
MCVLFKKGASMDREIWRLLVAAVRSADRRVVRSGRRPRYSDQRIVKMYLWSVWHDRPLCWACDKGHYNTMFRPSQVPSVSQFCRRMKTRRVQAMLEAIHEYLTRRDAPVGLSFLDGMPLPIRSWSRDRDARIGYASKGFARGYKLHAWASEDGRMLAYSVRPMNDGEAKVARDFANHPEMGGLVMADANYDSQRLYQTLGMRGAQLLTPLKRIAVNPGPLRRMGPNRRFAIRLNERLGDRYRTLLNRRDGIERSFSALCCFGGGLTTLPAWVRRLDRVTRWVSAKIAIYHARLRVRNTAA